MRLAALAAPLLLAAACDDSPGVDGDRVNTQMIENVAFLGNEMDDSSAAARLQPLRGVLARPPGLHCRFTHGQDVLVSASSTGAMVRVAGAPRMLRAEGTVSAEGGFFRDRELALSIGAEPGSPARARVTSRMAETQEDAEGVWSCSSSAG